MTNALSDSWPGCTTQSFSRVCCYKRTESDGLHLNIPIFRQQWLRSGPSPRPPSIPKECGVSSHAYGRGSHFSPHRASPRSSGPLEGGNSGPGHETFRYCSWPGCTTQSFSQVRCWKRAESDGLLLRRSLRSRPSPPSAQPDRGTKALSHERNALLR